MRGKLLFKLAFFLIFEFYNAVSSPSCEFSYGCDQDGNKFATITLKTEEDLKNHPTNAFSVHFYGTENALPDGAKMVLDVKWFPDLSPNFVCVLHLANMSECHLSGDGRVVQATIKHPSSHLEGKYKLQKIGYAEDQSICYFRLPNDLKNCKNLEETTYEMTEDSSANIGIIIGCIVGALVLGAIAVFACWRFARNHNSSRHFCLTHCCPCKQDQQTEQSADKLQAQNCNGVVDNSNHSLVKASVKILEERIKAEKSCASSLKPNTETLVQTVMSNGRDALGVIGKVDVGKGPEMPSRSKNYQRAVVEKITEFNGPSGEQGGEEAGDRKTGVAVLVAEKEKGEGNRVYRGQNQDNDNEQDDVKKDASCKAPLLRSDKEVNRN